MDKGKYSLLIGFYICIALTASLTSASEKDSRNIGDSVWNCTVEAMNKTLYSTFSSNISCEDQNRFQTCLNRNLKSSTKTMVQYSKSLATCKFPVQAVGSQAEVCVKDYFKHISTSPYIKKIQTKMDTASSPSLPTEQQKLYFCEALLLTSEAVGREVIFYCNLGGLEMYDKYFILSKLEYACKKALGVSLNDTNINDGGHTHTGGGAGDFDFGNFFSDPLFHITPFPTGAGTQTKTSTGSSGNTGTGNNIVSGPGGGTTRTTSASLRHIIGLLILAIVTIFR